LLRLGFGKLEKREWEQKVAHFNGCWCENTIHTYCKELVTVQTDEDSEEDDSSSDTDDEEAKPKVTKRKRKASGGGRGTKRKRKASGSAKARKRRPAKLEVDEQKPAEEDGFFYYY
jgi:hypothetical protein